jgi:hypothetical protein
MFESVCVEGTCRSWRVTSAEVVGFAQRILDTNQHKRRSKNDSKSTANKRARRKDARRLATEGVSMGKIRETCLLSNCVWRGRQTCQAADEDQLGGSFGGV